MGLIAGVIGWLGLIGLQVSLWPDLTRRFLPAFVLAAALAYGLTPGRNITGPARAHLGSGGQLWTGFWLAAGFGLVLDLYTGHHVGLLTIAYAAGYAAIWLVIRPPVDALGWPTRLTAAVIAAAIAELIITAVFGLTNSRFPFFAELFSVATLNVIGTVAAFVVFSGLFGFIRRRQR